MSLNLLVERDRRGKVPARIPEYENIDDAEARLYRPEIDRLDDLNAGLMAGKPVRMEYVVPGGASVGSIKRTHARHFRGEYEVLIFTEIRHLTSWRDNLPQAAIQIVDHTEAAPATAT